MGGAWQDHIEDVKDFVETRKLADLCILDEDILTIETYKIKDIRNLMTIVGGIVVYNSIVF